MPFIRKGKDVFKKVGNNLQLVAHAESIENAKAIIRIKEAASKKKHGK